MATFADRVRDRTSSHQPTIVNIGIGGSDLGPAMAAQALRSVRAIPGSAHMRFVS
jgi:glucose-6-phosphate isomerase